MPKTTRWDDDGRPVTTSSSSSGGGEKSSKKGKKKQKKTPHSRVERAVEREDRAAALTAERNEFLLSGEAGFLEAEEELERTGKVTQAELVSNVATSVGQQALNLRLDELGPYGADWSRNGRFLLLAGAKGHLSLLDVQKPSLETEFTVNETVRDACFLHNESLFAAAQRKHVYIYDRDGLELHGFHGVLHAFVDGVEQAHLHLYRQRQARDRNAFDEAASSLAYYLSSPPAVEAGLLDLRHDRDDFRHGIGRDREAKRGEGCDGFGDAEDAAVAFQEIGRRREGQQARNRRVRDKPGVEMRHVGQRARAQFPHRDVPVK